MSTKDDTQTNLEEQEQNLPQIDDEHLEEEEEELATTPVKHQEQHFEYEEEEKKVPQQDQVVEVADGADEEEKVVVEESQANNRSDQPQKKKNANPKQGGRQNGQQQMVYKKKDPNAPAVQEQELEVEAKDSKQVRSKSKKQEKNAPKPQTKQQYVVKGSAPKIVEGDEVKETQEKKQRERAPKTQQKMVYRPKGAPKEEGDDNDLNQDVDGDQEDSKKQGKKQAQKPKQQQSKPQYRVKDPNRKEEEEEKVEKDATEGGEDKQATNKRRNTNKRSAQNQKEGGRARSNYRGGEEKEPKEKKPLSAYQDYMYGDWRKPRPRIFVTLETEVPAMPKDIIEMPDETVYHKGQVEVDEKIDALNDKIRELSEKFTEKVQNLKDDQSGKGIMSKELRQLFIDMKTHSDEKKRIYDIVNGINKEIGDLEEKKTKLEKNLHPKFNKLDTLQKGIQEIEKTIQTTTTDAKREKELIREIQKIKDSKPFIEEINALFTVIREKKQLKFQTGLGLTELKATCKGLKTEIDKLKKGQDNKQVNKEQIQKDLDKINLQRNALRAEILELRKKKESQREEYYKKLIEYEKQQVIIREIEWIIQIKSRVTEREEQKKQWEEEKVARQEERKKRIEDQIRKEENMKKREEERRKQEEDKQKKWEEHMLNKLDIHPYLSEIELCDYLVKYCQKNMGMTFTGSGPHQPLTDFEKQEIADELRRKAIQEALQKGKLQRAETKEERQQKDMFAIQKEQQQKGGAVKKVGGGKPEQEETDQLNLDFLIIQKFSQIKISAPMKKSDLEKTIKELKVMKQAFLERGDIERDENKNKFLGEQRRNRGEKVKPDEEEKKESLIEQENDQDGQDAEYRANLKEKMRLVEQIGKVKKQKFNSNQYDDEGMDVDTFEANFVPEYEDEERPAGTRGGRDNYGGDRRGGRGGRGGDRGGRGGRGGDRGGRGGRGGYRNDNEGGRDNRGPRQAAGGRRAQKNYDDEGQDEGLWEDQYGNPVEKKEANPIAKKVGKKFNELFSKQEDFPDIQQNEQVSKLTKYSQVDYSKVSYV